jgi:hypothetical protein
MLEFVPLYPLQSYYRLDKGHPLADPSVNHIAPLTRLDKTSVFLAYVRGLAGTLAVIGFFVIVPGIMILTGERLDGFALSATRGLLVALIAGLAIGALSYLIPLTSRREREIRLRCEELLYLARDPAQLTVEGIASIQHRLDQVNPDPTGRLALVRELVRARINIARGQDVEGMERRTDELLYQLSLSSLGKNYSTEVRSEAVERRPLV